MAGYNLIQMNFAVDRISEGKFQRKGIFSVNFKSFRRYEAEIFGIF